MVRAIREVELSEVDGKASDEADPEGDPQGFAPQVARREHRQCNVQKQEKNLVVAAKIEYF